MDKDTKKATKYILAIILLLVVFRFFGINDWIRNNYQDISIILLIMIAVGIILLGKEIEKISDRLYGIEDKISDKEDIDTF